MKNVLLVDDDEIFNLLNTKSIQRVGIPAHIHTATNGKQAIDLINEYFQGTSILPDIILLDLNMPIMDGFSFIEAFRSIPLPMVKLVKIVIVTSSDNPEDIVRARELGIDKFMTKPVTDSDLALILSGLN
jgi:CheY-like chemotaxis protein